MTSAKGCVRSETSPASPTSTAPVQGRTVCSARPSPGKLTSPPPQSNSTWPATNTAVTPHLPVTSTRIRTQVNNQAEREGGRLAGSCVMMTTSLPSDTVTHSIVLTEIISPARSPVTQPGNHWETDNTKSLSQTSRTCLSQLSLFFVPLLYNCQHDPCDKHIETSPWWFFDYIILKTTPHLIQLYGVWSVFITNNFLFIFSGIVDSWREC